MVNISRAEAPSCCNHKFVKEPVCAFADQFTTVKAKRHQEGKAMKGDMLHNYTLLQRDGTRRVEEGSAYQVRKYRLSAYCSPPKRDGQGGKLKQGQNIHGFGLTQAFIAGKGRLWRQEGAAVAEQDLK
jgi:hypothetical protein